MKKVILSIIGVIVCIGIVLLVLNYNKEDKDIVEDTPDDIVETEKNFTIELIKKVNQHENYLISPYSIEIALNMLKDGTNGETYNEIEKVVGTRTIKDLSMGDKLSIANAAFIKDIYKNKVKQSYYSTLKNKYNADILYDTFTTPNVINDWVEKKTNGMIKDLLKEIEPEFVMGLANAVALDIKWHSSFDCYNTISKEFTKVDGTVMNTEMMHRTFEYGPYHYFETDDSIGVILPYQKEDNSDVELEFVGFLPKTSVDDFINNLTIDKLKNFDTNAMEASDKLNIRVALPRFSYEYKLEDFIEILKSLGIKKVFLDNEADFSNMLEKSLNENYYVSSAVHQTVIELNEKGTKAAAITYFSVAGNGIKLETPEIKEVIFDKPFVYMIRDKESKEILFFGSVYEPNKWTKKTCDSEM